MKNFYISFLTCLMTFSVVQAQFVDIGTSLPSLVNQRSLEWGDYDNDGDLDLLLTGQAEAPGLLPIIKLYTFDNNEFSEVEINIPGLYKATVKWIDADNDNDLDFILSGANNNFSNCDTYIAENQNGSYTLTKILPNTGAGIEVIDFDKDGDKDLIMSSSSETGLSMFNNESRNDSIIFTLKYTIDIPLYMSSFCLIDFDNDEDLDLTYSGKGEEIADYHMGVYVNNGNFTFTSSSNTFPSILGKIISADFDKDNDADILITGNHNYNEPIVRLFDNDGSGIFTERGQSLPQINGFPASADFDNDNDTDIFISGTSGLYPDFTVASTLLLNEGNYTFSEISAFSPPVIAVGLTVGDYDTDGDIDIAISGNDAPIEPNYITAIYNNQSILSDEVNIVEYVELYPNPAKDQIKISLNRFCADVNLVVYSLLGSVVQSAEYHNTDKIIHNLSDLPHGTYLLTLTSEGEIKTYKIIRN